MWDAHLIINGLFPLNCAACNAEARKTGAARILGEFGRLIGEQGNGKELKSPTVGQEEPWLLPAESLRPK